MRGKTTTISLQEMTRLKGHFLCSALGYNTLSALITHLINKEYDDKEVLINNPDLLEIFKEAQSIESTDYESLCRKVVLEGKITQAKNKI